MGRKNYSQHQVCVCNVPLCSSQKESSEGSGRRSADCIKIERLRKSFQPSHCAALQPRQVLRARECAWNQWECRTLELLYFGKPVAMGFCSTDVHVRKGNYLWSKLNNLHLTWSGNSLNNTFGQLTHLNGAESLKKTTKIMSGSKIRRGFVLQNLPTRWLFVCFSTDYHFKHKPNLTVWSVTELVISLMCFFTSLALWTKQAEPCWQWRASGRIWV